MKKLCLLFAFVAFTLSSCERSGILSSLNGENDVLTMNDNRAVRPIILGERKQNPFSLKNMQIALDTLKQIVSESDQTTFRMQAVNEIELEATDLYVRFLPQDSTQYYQLKNDTTLTLFDFPLDYEIVQSGDYYQDPTLQKPFTWYYATVKPDYVPPVGIKYEVLEKLFIAENSEYYSEELISGGAMNAPKSETESNSEYLDHNIFNALYAISFKLTGNEKELQQDNDTAINAPTNGKSSIMRITVPNCTRYTIRIGPWSTSWTSCNPYYYPDGYIKVNTPSGDVGLKGITVRMWRWFFTAEVRTNHEGYYYCPERFNSLWVGNNINYSIVFRGHNNDNSWDLERTLFGALALWDVKYNIGYHSPSGVNFTFDRKNGSWGRCIINNAIYDYCNISQRIGLSLPPKKLIIASSAVEKTWEKPFSAPILQNIYPWQFGLIDIFIAKGITPVGLGILKSMCPDLILKYPKAPFNANDWSDKNDSLNYNYTISSTWHELIHTAQFNRFEQEKGFNAASNYFFTYGTTIIGHAIAGSDNVYGKKGDTNWEIMALSEGWAYYNEWWVAKRYLSFNSFKNKNWKEKESYPTDLERNDTEFPEYFSALFYELFNIGCSINIMEKAISTNSLAVFESNLIAYYPKKKNDIETIFNKYE